jgi:hypothetical protein
MGDTSIRTRSQGGTPYFPGLPRSTTVSTTPPQLIKKTLPAPSGAGGHHGRVHLPSYGISLAAGSTSEGGHPKQHRSDPANKKLSREYYFLRFLDPI